MQEPDDLALLTSAAREAGDLAARYWHEGHAVAEKPGGQGPVTDADLAVDALLRDRLTLARPGYGWMSEESPDDLARRSGDTLFIVDPIDGTRAFVAHERSWSISLAVVSHGVPVVAVVYLPLPDKLYAARTGLGATLNGAPIMARPVSGIDGAAVLASRPAFDPEHWRGTVPEMKRHFRPSIAYRLALVAEGRYDAMVTFRDSWEWDVAAGALLVSEAGGTVTDRHGAALCFNTPDRLAAGVLAASSSLHAQIADRVA